MNRILMRIEVPLQIETFSAVCESAAPSETRFL